MPPEESYDVYGDELDSEELASASEDLGSHIFDDPALGDSIDDESGGSPARLIENLDSDSANDPLFFSSDGDDPPPEAGNRLGDFELIERLGAGGMGEVYRARQISLDRTVAVKVLPSTLARQDTFIERFRREAMKAASLIHPNVIQVYSFGVQDATPYFAMEYVEGEDLSERIQRLGGISVDEMVDVVIGVANALSCAAERSVVHRDIKPSNIMIDKNNVVKVMDFGLAKAASDVSQMSITQSGIIMGTPNYISPEQGRGDPTDTRSDLYSLGIVFYELLTGRLPFRADTPAGLIFKHVYEEPDPPRQVNPDVPPMLETIVLKMIAKDAGDRYQDPGDLLEDLHEFQRNSSHYMSGATGRPTSDDYLMPDAGDDEDDDPEETMRGVEPIALPKAGRSSPAPLAPNQAGSMLPLSDASDAWSAADDRARTVPGRRSGGARVAAEPPTSKWSDLAGKLGPEDEPILEDVADEEPPVLPESEERYFEDDEEIPHTPYEDEEAEPVFAEAADPALERFAREIAQQPRGGGSRLKLAVVAIAILAGGYYAHANGYLDQWLGKPAGGEVAKNGKSDPTTTPEVTTPVEKPPVEPGMVRFALSQLPLAQKGVEARVLRKFEEVPVELVDRDIEPGKYTLIFRKEGYKPVTVEYVVGADGAFVAGTKEPLADHAIELEPGEELVARFEKGKAQLAEKDLEAAEKTLAEVEKIDPYYPGLADLLASVRDELDAIAQSQEKLEEIHVQAAVLHGDKKWREALALLEQIPRPYQKYTDVLRLSTECKREIEKLDRRVEKGRDYLARGEFRDAEGVAEEVREADPQNRRVDALEEDVEKARSVLARADAQFDAAKWTDALASYEELIVLTPDFPHATSRRDQSEKQVQRQGELAEQVGAMVGESRSLLDAGRLDEALAKARAADKLAKGADPAARAAFEQARRAVVIDGASASLGALDEAIGQREGPASIVELVDPTNKPFVDQVRNQFAELLENGIEIGKSERREVEWLEVDEQKARMRCLWIVELVIPGVEGASGAGGKARRTKVQVPQILTFTRSGERWLLSGAAQTAKATAVQ